MINDKAKLAVEIVEALLAMGEQSGEEARRQGESIHAKLVLYKDLPGEADVEREHLPGKRSRTHQKLVLNGSTVHLGWSSYADGRLAEIFVDLHKGGSSIRGLCSGFAIAVSLGLQHGVPLQEFVDAFVGTRFEPSGPVIGEGSSVTYASSLLDLVFQELAASFGASEPEDVPDLVHV